MSKDLMKKYYDNQSDCFLKPPSETWSKIKKHSKKEIKKIEILKENQKNLVNPYSEDELNFLKKYGAFVLENVFSTEECEHYIKETESIGYQKLYGYHPSYRNNTRIIIQDIDLVQTIFERIKNFVPEKVQDENGKTWKLCGMNERFRWCKYVKGQHFSPHFDANFMRNLKEKSFFTFMIYLNGPIEAGCTRFLNIDSKETLDKIKPECGLAVIFPHKVYHDGEQLKSDSKYICRSDLMYRME